LPRGIAPNDCINIIRGSPAELSVYEELASLPLPHHVAWRYDYKYPKYGPTLLTLLSAWLAQPDPHDKVESLDRALLLFAAACIVVGPLQRENPAYRPWWSAQNRRLQEAFGARLGSDAWQWIDHQLPDRVFHQELENMLRTIPGRWVGAVQAKAADRTDASPIDALREDEVRTLHEELGEVISAEEEMRTRHASA